MPPLVAAVTVWAVSGTSLFASAVGVVGFGSTIVGSVVAGAVIGAAASAGTAAIMGKDVKSNALWGALAGSVAGGLAGTTGQVKSVVSQGSDVVSGGGSSGTSFVAEAGDEVAGAMGGQSTSAGSGLVGGASQAASQVPTDMLGESLLKIAQDNTKAQLISGAITSGASAMLKPDEEALIKAQTEAQKDLDQSRRVSLEGVNVDWKTPTFYQPNPAVAASNPAPTAENKPAYGVPEAEFKAEQPSILEAMARRRSRGYNE